MKKTLLFVLLLVPVLALSACKREPLINYETEPLGAPAGATLAQVTEAIVRACENQNWAIRKQEPGRITAELDIKSGKHSATVNIEYDTTQFSIIYWKSYNLHYRLAGSVEQIHTNYNIWVKLLKQKIQEYASAI